MSTTTCPNCQAQVPADAAFCDQCGTPLKGESGQAIPVPGICPNCRAAVGYDDQFCDNCGHALLPAPGFPESPQRPAETMTGANSGPAGPLAPHLLVQPAGTVLTLSPDQEAHIIGREDPASGSYPDVDLVPFGGEEGGVSRRHARISRQEEKFFIEDLNSVNYTFVNKQRIGVGVAYPLQDGDEIRLGRVLMWFKAR